MFGSFLLRPSEAPGDVPRPTPAPPPAAQVAERSSSSPRPRWSWVLSRHPPPPLTRPNGRPTAKGRWITETIAGMTVEEKVGQLFSTHVYGNTVDSYDASNVAEFGLRNAARDHREVPPRRGPLLRLDAQRGQPGAGRGPVQRHPAGVDVHRRRGAVADLHRPGGRPGRPGARAGHPDPGEHGPRRDPRRERAPATSRPSRAPSSRPWGSRRTSHPWPTSTSTRPTR